MVSLFHRLVTQGRLINHDIAMYKQAWSQPKAIESSINWDKANLPRSDDVSEADFWPQQESRINDVPALLIWGADDRVFSGDFLTVIPQYAADVRIHISPNTGQSPLIEKSDLFNQAVRNVISDK
ncbi:MAG: hypothetical protein P8Q37_10460 [Porticoccaceae bacterium]|nr:hypothetical protein [Porticoccaceae bacterium]MDG1475316.1 hypothetical protein [Porticoccaceae bacterium]